MKMSIRRVILLSILLALVSFSYADNDEAFSLTIKADGLRNTKGVVRFFLYNRDESIPDSGFKKYYRKKNGNINKGSSYAVFDNLPEGKYAVIILHDENMDGKMSRGLIFPVEGVGLTNFNSVGLMSRPSFLKASFHLTSNTEKLIKVIYF